MPPQQSHGLLDLFDQRLSFGAHASPSFAAQTIGAVAAVNAWMRNQ
jgi:hypothetical protein